MRVTCTVENIRDAALTVERFTGRHITLPILSHILCRADEKKILFIATNLEIGIEHRVNGKVQKPGQVTIPAKQFSQIVQSLRDENVALEVKQRQLNIHTPSVDVTLHGFDPGDFPNLPAIKKEHSFTVPTGLFTAALQRVIPAAATSTLKPEYAGIFFSAHPNTLTVAATDSFRLAEKVITDAAGAADAVECIVPARTAQEVLRTLGGQDGEEVDILVGEHQVVFAWGETRVLSRLVDGAYPPYKNIIPQRYETSLLVNREELLKNIRVAAVFSSRLNDITLRFSPAELEVSTNNAETGSTTARLAAKGRGVSGSAVFNYRYLLDGLEATGGEHALLSLNGGSGPALLQNPSDTSFIYLLMPIRSV